VGHFGRPTPPYTDEILIGTAQTFEVTAANVSKSEFEKAHEKPNLFFFLNFKCLNGAL